MVIKLIQIKSVVIVEGKYDKIALENIIDATIITTNGFGIYKDRGKRDLIRRMCGENGAVIITDSDSAGAQIRSYIKSFCDTENIINVYLPQIIGKEKRKAKPSKQGFIGVEGMDKQTIITALEKSGVAVAHGSVSPKITKSDLYLFGLSGCSDSKSARDSFSLWASLPTGISSNAFLDAVNAIFKRDEFIVEAKKWRQAQVKN